MPKTVFVPSKRRGHLINLHDHLSDLEVAERIDRLCDAKIEAKKNYFKEPKTAIVDMIGSAEDDEAMDLISSNLSSLGMPVLAFIPEMPTEAEIRKAMADTDEINTMIQQAKLLITQDKEE